MSKDTITRLIKKELILFKQVREKLLATLHSEMNSLGDDTHHRVLTPEEIQPVLLKLHKQGIGSLADFENGKGKTIELYNANGLFNGAYNELFSDDVEWYFIVPLDWPTRGALVTSASFFSKNMSYISKIFDDDFDLVNENLSSTVKFRGERANGVLSTCFITVSGQHFKKIIQIQ